MNPVQRSPLYLSNPYLTAVQSPMSPIGLPPVAGLSSLGASPLGGGFMGGGIIELMASIVQLLAQMLMYLFMGNSSGSPVLAPPNPGPVDPENPPEPNPLYPPPPKPPEPRPVGREPVVREPVTPEPGGGKYKPSPSGEKNLDRWDAQIEAAAKSTGLPANFIKATLWAESRGNPNDPSDNPDGKHRDLGVMQISNYTYGDVMKDQPNAPRGLDAANPDDNIMMGAWELKDKLEKHGSLFKTSMAYVGTGDSHEKEYAGWVQTYMQELDQGKKLSDF